MLFGSTMLEVALALILIYALLGVVSAGAIGLIELFTRQRRRWGWYGIMTLLGDDQEIARQLVAHPLIRPVGARPGRWPTDIPARSFALALLDVVAPSHFGEAKSLVFLSEKIAALPNQYLRHALVSLSLEVQTIPGLLTELGNLYESTMEGVTAGYRRRVYFRILIAAFLLSFLLNADTINIANSIPRYVDVRANLLSETQPIDRLGEVTSIPTPTPTLYPLSSPSPGTNQPTATPGFSGPVSTADTLREAKKQIDELANQQMEETRAELNMPYLPLGWSRNPDDPRTFYLSTSGWIFKALGILVTTLVASIMGQGLGLIWGFTENRSRSTIPRNRA